MPFPLFSNILLLLILVVLFSIAIATLHRWRIGIITIFIWLYLEDIIRRFLPGQPIQVMLIKDVLLFLTYFAFLATLIIAKNKRSFVAWKPPFKTSLLVFGGLCIAQSFNPNLPNLLFAAIGLRSYLWYMALLFLGYYMFLNQKGLIKFCRILVYTSIPLLFIAIAQYMFFDFMSPLIRPFVGAHSFHTFALHPNIKFVPSVFGASSRYASFAFLLFFLGMGLKFYPNNSAKQKFFINISILSAAVGVFISGVKTPMYLLTVGTLVYMFVYKKASLLNVWSQRKAILMPIALLSIILFLIVHFAFKDISLYLRHSQDDLLRRRPATLVTDISFAVKYAGLWGLGTGSRSQGLQYIPEGEEWASRGGPEQKKWGVEGGFAKIWYELGPIGAVILIIFFSQMFLSWLKEVRKLKRTTLYSMGLSIYVYLILMPIWFVKGHQIFGDATILVCFWFFMGVLLRLKNLAKQPYQ